VLGVGGRFPHFSLTASIPGDEGSFPTIADRDFQHRWKVYIFWAKDFDERSLWEILEFGELLPELHSRNAQLLGCSIESVEAHQAWRQASAELAGLEIPMLSDIQRNLTGELGVVDEREGTSQRATFIVDPQDVIRFVYEHQPRFR